MNAFERYRIRRKINAGGMATVYLAEDKVLGRPVAIKMLHSHLLTSTEAVHRFTNEAKAVATLSNENIIRIYDYGQQHDRPFIVMEYVDGYTLQEVINKNGALPNCATLAVIKQILSGLVCAHGKGIFHRDIKPANILVDTEGGVHITDFGIAYLVNKESITMTGTFLGSPHHISPEQAEGKPLNGTTDTFSLGILLYQCLTGALPYDAETPHAVINAIINDPPPDIRNHNRHMIFWIPEILSRCLEKDPALRAGSEKLISYLEFQCAADGIILDKSRISGFITDPEPYKEKEKREMFELYRNAAHRSIKSHCIPAALRQLSQASVFGQLLPSDQALIQRSRRQKNVIKFSLISFAVLLILVSSYAAFLKLQRLYKQSAVPVKITAAALDHDISHARDSIKVPIGSTVPKSFLKKAIIKKSTGILDSSKETISSIKTGKDQDCMICIQTNPPWVTVRIDDIDRGLTPRISCITVNPGRHALLLEKKGFNDYFDTIETNGSDTMSLRVRLTASE